MQKQTLRLTAGLRQRYRQRISPRMRDSDNFRCIDRYPDAQMYLTGSTAEDGAQASFKIDDPEQIAILAKPQQLATIIKQYLRYSTELKSYYAEIPDDL